MINLLSFKILMVSIKMFNFKAKFGWIVLSYYHHRHVTYIKIEARVNPRIISPNIHIYYEYSIITTP